MADISEIKLPNDLTYNIKDSIRGVEFIVGTQVGETDAWLGETDRDALFDGMQIKYFLPFASPGDATINLTLKSGDTTGAKPIYSYGTTALVTSYPAGSCIGLTYSTKNVETGAWYVENDIYDVQNIVSSTITSGYNFGSIEVDENGDLYITMVNFDNCPFEYEASTGNLYYVY